jgi:hypothetical protein
VKFDPAANSTYAGESYDTVRYLGIDPGESNGVCGYDHAYKLMFMYTVAHTDMREFLNLFKHLQVIVCEDFFLYPNKAMQQIYSNMETSQMIGRIKTFAEDHDIKVVMQQATIKPTGYKWLGLKPLPKSNPSNHEFDAHVHFMYWLIRMGKIDARTLLQK